MKLTTKKIKINQIYIKSIFTSLFLKVPVFTTTLRSLGSLLEQVPYLLVYKSTFYDQKISQKNPLDLYTSHTQRPDQAIRENSITTA